MALNERGEKLKELLEKRDSSIVAAAGALAEAAGSGDEDAVAEIVNELTRAGVVDSDGNVTG